MRWSLFFAFTVATLALAGPSRGGRLSRDDDEPVKPVPAAPPTVNDADASLLRGLLYATEPAPTEIRVIAVEDLGLIGDPRALNPLAQLLMDPNPAVQAAALR